MRLMEYNLAETQMDNNKNNETQNRREFFKKAARKALPILGAVALMSNPMIARAVENKTTDCGSSCYGACIKACKDQCYGGCDGKCDRSCKSDCRINCKGESVNLDNCRGGCQNLCYGRCSGGCRQECSGSCIGNAYKSH